MFHPSVVEREVELASRLRPGFISNGYAVIEDFWTEDLLRQAETEVAKLIEHATREQNTLYGVIRNSENYVVVMNRLDKHSDFLYDLARHTVLLRLAEAFIGKPAISLHVEYFAKPSVRSTPTPPHQDHQSYQDHFSDELAVAFWIPFDTADENSGALQFAAPSPLSLLPHTESTAFDFDFEVAAADARGWRTAVARRGSAVVHHSYSIHRADANTSGHERRAIVFNYRGSSYRHHLRAGGDSLQGG